jgi:uncharacterized membrane protein YeiH
MVSDVFTVPPLFDYGATLLWAVSGAMVGARLGYDIIGILIVALVSATGGGLLRDGVFLQDGTPIMLRSPYYLILVVIGTLVVLLFGKRVRRAKSLDMLINLVDGLGLGAYAVIGMDRATTLGVSTAGVVLVGMVNAVGGGVLRAMVTGREPRIFRPGTLQAAAALIGCILFLVLVRLGVMEQTRATWVTIAVVFAIRVLSVHYKLETRALRAFEEDWTNRKTGPL